MMSWICGIFDLEGVWIARDWYTLATQHLNNINQLHRVM